MSMTTVSPVVDTRKASREAIVAIAKKFFAGDIVKYRAAAANRTDVTGGGQAAFDAAAADLSEKLLERIWQYREQKTDLRYGQAWASLSRLTTDECRRSAIRNALWETYTEERL